MGCGGSTPPVFAATGAGDAPKVRDLIRANPNICKQTFNGDTVLHYAACFEPGDETKCMDALLEAPGNDLNALNKEGLTPMHCAALRGRSQAMRALIKSGAKADVKAPAGSTALHLAAGNSGGAPCIQVALDSLISPDLKDSSDQTPLHIASSEGNVACVKVLVEGKAAINAVSHFNGRTPLHNAAANGQLEVVELLMKSGADLQIKDSDGRMPVHLADAAGHKKCVQKLGVTKEEDMVGRSDAALAAVGGTHGDSDPEGLQPASEETRRRVQALMDATWKDQTTRDRGYEKVKRFEVVQVQENTNLKNWDLYCQRRDAISLHYVEPLKDVKTATVPDWESGVRDPRNEKINEFFLFHGTKPAGAQAICSENFRVDLSGTNKGSLYGPGIYLAESSSKGDEYADDDKEGVYKGLYAMLLCRVTLGNPVVSKDVTPDIQKLKEALAADDHQSILGDREAARGTYREFIVQDPTQVYPAYAIIYRRKQAS